MCLTTAGRELLAFVDKYEDQVRSLQESLLGESVSLSGVVRYAMPESCLLSPHFSMLLKAKARQFPDVDLQVNLLHSEKVVEYLLKHEADFGFVTKSLPHPDVNYEPFCKEEYVLVVSKSAPKVAFDSARWIIYPGFDDAAEKWTRLQSKRDKAWPATMKTKHQRSLSGQSNSLRAALSMVAHGMGVTISPRHCIEAVSDGHLVKSVTDGFRIVENQIFIATLKTRLVPKRVQKTIDTFKAMV